MLSNLKSFLRTLEEISKMDVSEFTDDQVEQSISRIETAFARPNGEVDILSMSQNKILFDTWRRLLKRRRERLASLKRAERNRQI